MWKLLQDLNYHIEVMQDIVKASAFVTAVIVMVFVAIAMIFDLALLDWKQCLGIFLLIASITTVIAVTSSFDD